MTSLLQRLSPKTAFQNLPECLIIAFFGMLILSLNGSLDFFLGAFRFNRMTPIFADLRTIPTAAFYAANLTPRGANSFDLWGRAFNYPEIWIFLFDFLRALRLDPVLVVGYGQILALAGAALITVRRLKHTGERWLLIALLCSPPIVLLLERGNSDTLIFLLCLLSLRGHSVGRGIAIGLAAALKLYPLVWFLPLWGLTGKRAPLVLGLSLTAPLWGWTLLQSTEILTATPHSGDGSTAFGLRATRNSLGWWAEHLYGITLPSPVILAGSLVSLLLIGLVFYAFNRRNITQITDDIAASSLWPLLLAFGFLHLALFVMASSWAYRLIFFAPVAFSILRFSLWTTKPLSPWFRAFLGAAFGLPFVVPFLPYGWMLFSLAVALSIPILVILLIQGVRRPFPFAPRPPI